MNTTNLNIHADLIAQCRKNEENAQLEIYQLYSKAMFNTALRICGDWRDAEDVLQEAFLSAFRSINSYREDASFGAWLKRIVINKSLNSVKKRSNERIFFEKASDVDLVDVEQIEPQDYSVEKIKTAVSNLAPGFRAVLTLYLFEGYDHQEISEILGVSESTSKSQYKRAKDKLKIELQGFRNYG